MEKIQVFLDTDVVISALLSQTGASYEVINNSKVKKIVSKAVKKEIVEVTKRLDIGDKNLKSVLKNIKIVSLNLKKKTVEENYSDYVFDKDDTHVIAGGHISKSKFTLTHNLKHYRVNRINSDLKIIVLKPGNFLQYLRSLDKF